MDESKLLERITVNPDIFGGKPIIRGRRLAVEHILGMLAAGDAPETIRSGYGWLKVEDIQACLLYARKGFCNILLGGRLPLHLAAVSALVAHQLIGGHIVVASPAALPATPRPHLIPPAKCYRTRTTALSRGLEGDPEIHGPEWFRQALQNFLNEQKTI